MIFRLKILSLCFVTFFQNPVSAEPGHFTKFAIGTCYHPIDDINRVKAMARISKWKSMPTDMLEANRAITSSSDYTGWVIQDDHDAYMIAVNTGLMEGKKSQVCTAVANEKPSEVKTILKAQLNLKLVTSRKEAYQKWEMYSATHLSGKKIYVVIMGAEDEQKPPVNVSFISY